MSNDTELLEVLDENGVGLGHPEQRSEVHKLGLWHRAIIVAIVNNKNEVLIQKRAATKDKFPGLWDISVAGHVPFGHDSVSCAATETMEEIGYMLSKNVQVRDFRFMTSFRNQLPISDTFLENQYYDFFVYNADLDISKFNLQETEVSEVKWASPYEIKMMAERGLFHPRTEWIKVLYNYMARF